MVMIIINKIFIDKDTSINKVNFHSDTSLLLLHDS